MFAYVEHAYQLVEQLPAKPALEQYFLQEASVTLFMIVSTILATTSQ